MDFSSLLNQTVSGPLSTTVKVVKEGEYKAVIDDGDKAITFKEIKTANGVSHQAVILFSVLDEAVRKDMGREKVLVPMNVWLDFVPGTTNIDTGEGKNVSLGRLREALGQNVDNEWNFGKLKGKGPLVVKITQRADGKDPTIKYAEVNRVAKIS